jgi:hypothetical protein
MKKVLFLIILVAILFTGCVRYVPYVESFYTLDIIKEARDRILAENPGVELDFYEFTGGIRAEDGTAYGMFPRGAKSVDDLIWWEFIFAADEGNTAVITKMNDVWAASQIVPQPWLEDEVYDPEYLRIDLDDAIEILKIYLWGGTAPLDIFDFVVFRQPLNPVITEPYYIFTVAPGYYVFVGAITGSIRTEEN